MIATTSTKHTQLHFLDSIYLPQMRSICRFWCIYHSIFLKEKKFAKSFSLVLQHKRDSQLLILFVLLHTNTTTNYIKVCFITTTATHFLFTTYWHIEAMKYWLVTCKCHQCFDKVSKMTHHITTTYTLSSRQLSMEC